MLIYLLLPGYIHGLTNVIYYTRNPYFSAVSILEALPEDAGVRALAVKYILEGRTEEALNLLSRHYGIPTPKLRIGLPKKCRSAYGCYVAKQKTIYLRSSEEYKSPFVVLHEYYHHLRSIHGKHRGTEKNADLYAADSIRFYKILLQGR